MIIGQGWDIPADGIELPALGDIGLYWSLMRIKDQWEARPAILGPQITHEGALTSLQFADLPANAAATITDVETGQVLATVQAEGGSISFQLSDPGTYIVCVAAPDPVLPWEGRITC